MLVRCAIVGRGVCVLLFFFVLCANPPSHIIKCFMTCGTLLNVDLLRRRAFFLNHEGNFGNQEGKIT